MRRREFIAGFGTVVAWPLIARAQQAQRTWRLGMLETTSMESNRANVNSLRKALGELGYVDRQNLVIEYRSADGDGRRFPRLAAELIDLKVDLIVARGTPAALASKYATSTIPIVTTALANPFSVVASLARPGGNITGLSSLLTDLHAKRIELLHDVIPGITRVAVLLNFSNPNTARSREDIETGARSLGIRAQFLKLQLPEDIRSAFDDASGERAEALFVTVDTLTQANAKLIVELAAKQRLPALYGSREFVDLGGLVSFGVNYPDLYRRAATYIDKILKGTPPADLPVEQPTKFELVINLKTAKALGLTVPPLLLARADEVIE